MGDIKCERKGEVVFDNNISYGNYSSVAVDLSMATYLNNMLKENKYVDVHFTVINDGSKSTFPAHKLIPSLWSPYFADMFNDQDAKIGNRVTIKDITIEDVTIKEVTIKDVNPTAFASMLRFMYGIFPAMKTCKEAFEIFKVSENFQVEYLMNASRSRVEEIKLEVWNVFEILEASIHMGLTFLKECCLKLIQERTAEVFASNDIAQVSSSIVREILELRSFSLASEYDLLEWVFLWAKNQYATIAQYSSDREVLKEFLPKLYFVSLSSQEFAELFKLHEAFFDRDEAFSILMNIAIRKSWPLPEWQDPEFNFRVYTG